jgi:homoserine O-acetyltransferase
MLAASLSAQGPTGGVEGDFEMRDFKFTDGPPCPSLRIHYTTLGQPKKDARGIVRNAVLILHGTTGNGRGFLSRNFGVSCFKPASR